MAPLTNAQISIDRWSKLLLIGCVLLIMVSGHAFFGCGQRHGHHHGPRGEFHPDGQNSAAVSFAAGDSMHASASFSLSLSHGKPEQQQQEQEQESEQQGAASEGRGRGFRPHHRGGHFGARHGRRHRSHSHEQQKPEQQQPEQQPEILPAVNAGTFDVKIQPARMADIKMPAAPRAVAIPLDLPAVDTVAEAGAAADSSKPEPRPRHHHERRIMPRRAFRPDQQEQPQQEQPQQLPVEQQQPQQEGQEQQPQQKEGQMEQFPVIVDDLQQPMVDPIPPVFMQEGEQKNLPHPHPHPHGFGGKKGRCCCAQRRLAGLGLATGATGVIAAFRPSRCGVALFLVGVLVVEVLMLLRVSNHVIKGMERCMDGARTVDEINACGDFGRRAGITATLIIGVIAASFASCGARLGRGVVAREQEERVEAEAGAISHAIIAGASVPIVVGSCDLAPLPAYVLAVEGTACVDAEEQQGGACTV